MKFLCLGYLNMDKFDSIPESEKQSILERCADQCIPFRASGNVVMEEGVRHYSEAKVIQLINGVAKVTGGTLLPSPLQLGSVFIIEATGIDEAIKTASLHPAALFAEEFDFSLEVRPLQ